MFICLFVSLSCCMMGLLSPVSVVRNPESRVLPHALRLRLSLFYLALHRGLPTNLKGFWSQNLWGV